jgi:BirA family transcriptional regulator, biotin operon repressor / biotin---[acetyl-CoA-carboxylase] ligase
MDKEQKPEIFKPDGSAYTIYKYAKLDSTNTFLKQHCSTLPDYSVIWAEEQIHGRGRFTRVWNSEPGKDLTFSLLLPLTSLEHKLRQNITQTAALSIAQLLEDYGLKPAIKWPNDVLVHGGKISGILCEVVESDKAELSSCEKAYGILGIGLNINSTEKSLAGLDYPATSLRCVVHHSVVPLVLLNKLLKIIINCFNVLCKSGFTQNRLEIKKRLAFMNEQIVFTDVKRNLYRGNIIDLNNDGTLLFECEKCGVISLNSGEITFKHLYI